MGRPAGVNASPAPVLRLRHLRRRAVLAACLALAAGCTVGPDFRPPQPPLDSGYTMPPAPPRTAQAEGRHGGAQVLDDGADVPERWWTLFGSPALDRTVEAALAANPGVAQARARLEQAGHDLAARSGATQWPAIDARLSSTRQQVDIKSLGITAFPSPGPFTLYGASVQVSYVLDLFGAQRRELEGLRAAVDYQRFEWQAARLALAANVVTAAIREAGLRAQIAELRAQTAAQRRSLDITRARLAAGGVAEVDVRRQQGVLDQTEAQLPGLARQLAASRHQLAVYLGLAPAGASDDDGAPDRGSGEDALPAFDLDTLHLPAALPLSLPSTLAQRRPDIAAAQALLQQASANIGVATANLYPQLTLSGSAGTQGLSAGDLFRSLNVWSLAAGLAQPVFHGGELLERRRSAQAAYAQSLAAYRQVVLQGLLEVADALRALEADALALRARADAAQRARETLDIVAAQYRAGGVSQLALLDAERQYRQAAQDLVQAQAARLADSAALLQALGGGWWQETETETETETEARTEPAPAARAAHPRAGADGPSMAQRAR